MTSQSRKKRPITARTYNRAKCLSLSLLLATTAAPVVGQVPGALPTQHHSARRAQPTQQQHLGQQYRVLGAGTVSLVPVPRESDRSVHRPVQTNPQRQGWNLRWRRSPNASKQVQPVADSEAAAASHRSNNRSQQDHSLRVATDQPNLRPVTQTAWVDDANASSGIRLSQAQADGPNFFSDPFGDDAQPDQTQAISAADPQEEALFAPPADEPVTSPNNNLRNTFDQLNDPPAPAAKAESSFGEMLRENKPDEVLTPPIREMQDPLPPPERRQLPDSEAPGAEVEPSGKNEFENPFDQLRGLDADKIDRDRLNSGKPEDIDAIQREGGVRGYGAQLKPFSGVSCDEFRQRIAEQTIDQVSLDISPPFRPDVVNQAEYEQAKAEFDEKQAIRQWRAIDGSELATGRLRDLAYEKAIIETEDGSVEELAVSRLSEADLVYIADSWKLPKQCLLEQVAYTPRNWAPTTMTWKASNLCHTPLYFQDVNLERYGHTHGPVLEPVVQSAHFFANIAVLPYKMGVHSPKECQYALGYYRPGNCAPWIVPPVPLSLRGAISQTAVMTGMFWLIP